MSETQQAPALARLEATVHGRVQGVSFRFHTLQQARRVDLTGYVRNLRGGSVEVVAEGPRRDLDALLAFLRAGPRGAVVTQLEVRWGAPTGSFERFEVRY